MIHRIIGSGRGIAGMVAYITHDQASADDRRPTTSKRVAWTACLGITKQHMMSAVAGALESIRLDHRHYAVCAAHTDTACPHVHIAVSRVDPETGKTVTLDSRATTRLNRWAEQYERENGGIVVPGRVARREAQAARRGLERRCRRGGMQPDQARSTAARLYPWPASKPARKKPPSPPVPRRSSVRSGGASSNSRRSRRGASGPPKTNRWRASDGNGGPTRRHGPRRGPPAPPPHPLRADGARERLALRRSYRAERMSLARRLGRAVHVWVRSTAAIRKLFRRPPPEVDLAADRRQLDADLTDARRRRSEQTRERLAKTARDASAAYDRAYSAFRFHREYFGVVDSPRGSAEGKEHDRLLTAVEVVSARDKHARNSLARWDRAVHNMRRKERGEPPRRTYSAPYAPSLEQLAAEADRKWARERRQSERVRPRSETEPARTPAPAPRTRPPAPPARPRPAKDAPATVDHDIVIGVTPENPETPPAPGRQHPDRRTRPDAAARAVAQVPRLGALRTPVITHPEPPVRRASPSRRADERTRAEKGTDDNALGTAGRQGRTTRAGRQGRIPDFPVTRSHPPASWPSAANSSICRTYRKTAGEESRRRSPVANRWMRP